MWSVLFEINFTTNIPSFPRKSIQFFALSRFKRIDPLEYPLWWRVKKILWHEVFWIRKKRIILFWRRFLYIWNWLLFFWMMDSWFKDSVCHYQCKCQVFGGFWIESTQGRIKVTTIYYQPINHYWLIGNASLGCIGSWKMFEMISLKMKVKAKSVYEHKIQDFAKNSYGRSSFDRVMSNNHL